MMYRCDLKQAAGRIIFILSALGCFPVCVSGNPLMASADPNGLMPGLFTASLTPSPEPVTGVVDSTPAPVNVDRETLRSTIEKVRSSIFFLEFIFEERANVKMDSFLIPNGDYSETDVQWNDLRDANGRRILRSPTEEEKKKDQQFGRSAWSRIYHAGGGKPVAAAGQMQIRIPVRFAQITPQADEVGTSRGTEALEGLTVQLDQCENDVAAVQVTGPLQDTKPIIIFYDRAGRRLSTGESFSMNSPTGTSLSCRVNGTIASVRVFVPMDYVSETFEVQATAEPETFGENAWVIQAARYLRPTSKPEFHKTDAAAIKKETNVVGRRTYAIAGFNEPTIMAFLPKRDNSAFANVKMEKLALFDASGEAVEHRLTGGWFDYETLYKRFDLADKESDEPVEYNRSVGRIKVHYPTKLELVTLQTEAPEAGGLKAVFDGPRVTISGMELEYEPFAPDRLAVLRGYDGQGRRLRILESSGFRRTGEKFEKRFGFWGIPVKLEIVVPAGWVDVEIPFDIPTADKLQESQIGLKPRGY